MGSLAHSWKMALAWKGCLLVWRKVGEGLLACGFEETYDRTRPALELGFYAPGEVGTAVFGEDGVGDEGVYVFRVD
jgi:hypothetical protein